jgi:hypothetical protein
VRLQQVVAARKPLVGGEKGLAAVLRHSGISSSGYPRAQPFRLPSMTQDRRAT